jgi:hypothetical protein
MQAAEPDGDFRKIANIIFPAFAKKAGGGRKQAKINLRQRQATRAKGINEGQGIIGIAESRKGGEGFDIFLGRRGRMCLIGFMPRVVQNALRKHEPRDYLGLDHPLQGKGPFLRGRAPFHRSGPVPVVGV